LVIQRGRTEAVVAAAVAAVVGVAGVAAAQVRPAVALAAVTAEAEATAVERVTGAEWVTEPVLV
jgi:hypothetical protein